MEYQNTSIIARNPPFDYVHNIIFVTPKRGRVRESAVAVTNVAFVRFRLEANRKSSFSRSIRKLDRDSLTSIVMGFEIAPLKCAISTFGADKFPRRKDMGILCNEQEQEATHTPRSGHGSCYAYSGHSSSQSPCCR